MYNYRYRYRFWGALSLISLNSVWWTFQTQHFLHLLTKVTKVVYHDLPEFWPYIVSQDPWGILRWPPARPAKLPPLLRSYALAAHVESSCKWCMCVWCVCVRAMQSHGMESNAMLWNIPPFVHVCTSLHVCWCALIVSLTMSDNNERAINQESTNITKGQTVLQIETSWMPVIWKQIALMGFLDLALLLSLLILQVCQLNDIVHLCLIIFSCMKPSRNLALVHWAPRYRHTCL